MATKKKTFEEAIAELETIVEALENGSASLEDSLICTKRNRTNKIVPR